jgi:hypothetical protein
MEEIEYREVYDRLNPYPCAFEKAILSGRCGCVHCQRIYLAEREGAACLSPQGAVPCAELVKELRQNAKFALRISQVFGPLPHTKEMKVQCGGLLGLQAALFPELAEDVKVTNVYALVTQAIATFERIDKLPYQKIVKFIGHYQVRKK